MNEALTKSEMLELLARMERGEKNVPDIEPEPSGA